MSGSHPYESILESISGGFFALDHDFVITYWNRAAESGTRLPAGEVIGKNVFDVFPNARDSELGEKYMLAMSTQTYQSLDSAYRDERDEAWFNIRMYPSETGLSVFFQDITEKKKEQRQKEILFELSGVINAARHLDELCVGAAERVAALMGIPSKFVCVYLFDPRGNEIRLVAPALLDVEFPQEVVHQPVNPQAPRIAALAASGREVSVSADLTQSTVGHLFAGEVAELGLRTMITVPLMVQGELQGVLEVLTMKETEYVVPELEMLSIVANDLAGGMSRKRLVDELRTKNLQLEAQTQKTEDASETLKKFLATFSHELRSPLNSIIGFSEIIAQQLDELPPASVREFMKNITVSGRHLQQIINDILDLSKIESGTLELHLASYPSSYFQESVESVLAPAMTRKEVQLRFAFNPDLEEFVVDQTRFKQILINLVSNAIKFSRQGGEITVRSERVGNDLKFSVIDRGVGMKPEEQMSIFRPFKQAASGREMNQEGIGLGLAITKRLVELHGGSMSVESEYGVGTTMSFTIPMIVDATAEKMARAGMLLEALQREHKPLQAAEKPLALVVEDAPQASELLRMYIESAGYRVETARNGADAIEMAKRLRPSVITLDLMLPIKDGWQVLKELKRHPLCKHIPVIIVSIMDEKNLGFSLGAVDYFVKPVNRDDLIAALDKVHLVRRAENRKPTVLVIDDDRAATDLVQVILEGEGFSVLKAYRGAEGVEIATRERPDLIILDLIMPETSGFNIAYQLKQIPATRGIPIVILTSMEIDEEEAERLGMYVSGLMSKSTFTKKDLLREIAHLS